MSEIIVKELNYYPIKSCRGISIERAVLDSRGIIHDREFMVVGKNGEGKYKLVRQSNQPRMALIEAQAGDHILQASAPGIENLEIPITKYGPKLEAAVHSSLCEVMDQGEKAAGWLRKYLGQDFRLVRMASDFVRTLNPLYAKRESDQVGLQDGYPLLMISDESLNDLNSRLKEPVQMNRFRPNIVIKGSGVPYIEDNLKRIKVGGMYFDLVKPCDRCSIPNINQESGVPDPEKEVTRKLDSYRRAKFDGEIPIFFGQNIVHETPGRISIGDKVEILEYKKEEEKLQWITK